jgi:hypothetical protein
MMVNAAKGVGGGVLFLIYLQLQSVISNSKLVPLDPDPKANIMSLSFMILFMIKNRFSKSFYTPRRIPAQLPFWIQKLYGKI